MKLSFSEINISSYSSRYYLSSFFLKSVVPIGLYSLSLWLSNSAYIYLSVSFMFLFFPWIFVEFPILNETSTFHFDYVIFGSNLLCAFALNLAVFLLVGKTSALTMNVAGVVKDWLLIVVSWSVIKDTVTPINLFGYGLAFLGVAYYNHCKLQTLKAKEAQRKLTQGDEEAGRLLEEKEADNNGGRKNGLKETAENETAENKLQIWKKIVRNNDVISSVRSELMAAMNENEESFSLKSREYFSLLNNRNQATLSSVPLPLKLKVGKTWGSLEHFDPDC